MSEGSLLLLTPVSTTKKQENTALTTIRSLINFFHFCHYLPPPHLITGILLSHISHIFNTPLLSHITPA